MIDEMIKGSNGVDWRTDGGDSRENESKQMGFFAAAAVLREI